MKIFEKRHLGDSVYCEVEDGMFKLTTEDGVNATHTIFLQPDVFEELARYVTKAYKAYNEHYWPDGKPV